MCLLDHPSTRAKAEPKTPTKPSGLPMYICIPIPKPYFEWDQLRLYRLIWERFVASQMAPAIVDTVGVDIQVEVHLPGNGLGDQIPWLHDPLH